MLTRESSSGVRILGFGDVQDVPGCSWVDENQRRTTARDQVNLTMLRAGHAILFCIENSKRVAFLFRSHLGRTTPGSQSPTIHHS